MTHPAALAQEDLARLTGYQRPSDLEKWCIANRVSYFRSKAGIWTTVAAVNAALGLTTEPATPPRAASPNWSALQ